MHHYTIFIIIIAIVSVAQSTQGDDNVPHRHFAFGHLTHFLGYDDETHRKILEGEWNRLSAAQQKQINNILFGRIGLSSTGHYSLIGVYSLTHDEPLGKVGDKIFQFQQADLGGQRLVRVVLINPTSGNALLLYSPGMETSRNLLRFGVAEQASTDQPATRSEGDGVKDSPIMIKLREIRVENLDFLDVPLRRVTATLNALSQEYDTTGISPLGISLMLREPGWNPSITLSLNNVSIEKILNVLVVIIDLKYEMTEEGVILSYGGSR